MKTEKLMTENGLLHLKKTQCNRVEKKKKWLRQITKSDEKDREKKKEREIYHKLQSLSLWPYKLKGSLNSDWSNSLWLSNESSLRYLVRNIFVRINRAKDKPELVGVESLDRFRPNIFIVQFLILKIAQIFLIIW